MRDGSITKGFGSPGWTKRQWGNRWSRVLFVAQLARFPGLPSRPLRYDEAFAVLVFSSISGWNTMSTGSRYFVSEMGTTVERAGTDLRAGFNRLAAGARGPCLVRGARMTASLELGGLRVSGISTRWSGLGIDRVEGRGG